MASSTTFAPTAEHVVVDYHQPHWKRREQILRLHPQVNQLFRKEPLTAVWVIVLVAANFTLAYLFALIAASQQQPHGSALTNAYSRLETVAYWCSSNVNCWLLFSFTVYFIGAVIDHALWVLIHDLGHELVFLNSNLNTFFLCLANVPHVIPCAVSFRHYHRQHHGHLNEAYDDPDIPEPYEADFVGNSPLNKALWLLAFPFVQLYRSNLYATKAKQQQQQRPSIKARRTSVGGIIADFMASFLGFDDPVGIFLNYVMNLGLVIGFVFACLFSTGSVLGATCAFAYLSLSFVFSIGFHPLGARWIAEHYAVSPPQETYSYYGSLNLVAFNIGYHNEHHDFPGVIPWNRLPELRKIANEFYEPLYQHQSYTKLLCDFIFDRRITLRSRVVRKAIAHHQP
eukprot:GEZU01036867.1.p1 GENE.GEZU01036867.1~~GEZU01036867.1.p1  ORF type:complete len:398 (+),score=45.62 GEZU01036867.1:87-1280(+)